MGVFFWGGGGMTFHKHVYVYGKIISRNFNDYYNTGNYSKKKTTLKVPVIAIYLHAR